MPHRAPPGSDGVGPKRVVVVGAGIVGLATAWFLQEYGVEVTVVDGNGVGTGSSWGNAGWICPGLVTPLAEPSVLRYGLRSLVDPTSALYVPPTFDVALWRFLVGFARHCTIGQWRRAMSAYVSLNGLALDAFDELRDGGLSAPTINAPIMVGFEHAEQANALRHELALIADAGQRVEVAELSRVEARAAAPQIADRMELVWRMDAQRYLDPGAYVQTLAETVVARGAHLRIGDRVRTITRMSTGIRVALENGDGVEGDAVVVATGAWLNDLSAGLGVRMRVRAGRGYSFSVTTEQPVPAPIYIPAARVACTPYQGGLRIGGGMEFRSVDAPIDQKRVETILKSAESALTGIDWSSKRDEWVGSRPVSVDSLPLIGATRVPGVYLAGGHGMWGITLGPVSGKLLAQQVVTGQRSKELASFNPLR